MGKNKEDGLEVENDNQQQPPGEQYIKLKASNSHKGPYEFDCLQHVQVKIIIYTIVVINQQSLRKLLGYKNLLFL